MGHYINYARCNYIACSILVVFTLVAVVIRLNEIVLHCNFILIVHFIFFIYHAFRKNCLKGYVFMHINDAFKIRK